MIRSSFLPKLRDVVNPTMPRSRCPMPLGATGTTTAPQRELSRGSRYVPADHVADFIRPADTLAHHAHPLYGVPLVSCRTRALDAITRRQAGVEPV